MHFSKGPNLLFSPSCFTARGNSREDGELSYINNCGDPKLNIKSDGLVTQEQLAAFSLQTVE